MTTYFDYETLRDTVTAQAIKIHQIEQERDTPAPMPGIGKSGE